MLKNSFKTKLVFFSLLALIFTYINTNNFFITKADILQQPNKKSNISEDEDIRKLWNSQFLEKRPLGKKRKTKLSTARNYKKLKSIIINNNELNTNPLESTLVGLTLWQLKKVSEANKENDLTASRIFAQVDSEDLIPERIDINKPILAGQKFRFAVEVAQTGYLYIIDQERYNDGTLGDPYLIFPTSKIRQGNNKVKSGISVEVPDQSDKVPYFTLLVNNPKYVGEQLTIVVSPAPIKEIPISATALKLSKEQVENLQKLQSSVQILNLEGSTNNAYTTIEKMAGKGNTLLTQQDPLPQTLYQVATKPNTTFVFSIPIAVKDKD